MLQSCALIFSQAPYVDSSFCLPTKYTRKLMHNVCYTYIHWVINISFEKKQKKKKGNWKFKVQRKNGMRFGVVTQFMHV